MGITSLSVFFCVLVYLHSRSLIQKSMKLEKELLNALEKLNQRSPYLEFFRNT